MIPVPPFVLSTVEGLREVFFSNLLDDNDAGAPQSTEVRSRHVTWIRDAQNVWSRTQWIIHGANSEAPKGSRSRIYLEEEIP